MKPSSRVSFVALPGLLLAALLLAGCSAHHGDPWINAGQKARLGDQIELDEQKQQQLRDRAKAGQRQR